MNRLLPCLLALLLPACAQPGAHVACIEIADTAADDFRDTFVVADFHSGPACAIEATLPEGCTLVRSPGEPFFGGDFDSPPMPSPVLAGRVVVSGLGSEVSLDRRESGVYDAALPSLTAGGRVRIAATGDELAPFSIETSTPGLPAVTAPDFLAPGDDLELRWTPPLGSPEMIITVADSLFGFGGPSAVLQCNVDASTGSLVIPAADVGSLDTHGTLSGIFVISSYRLHQHEVLDGVDVTLDVVTQYMGPRIER